MAVSLVGGADVEAVFGGLVKAVLEMKDKAKMFKPTLAYLRSTLIAIDPVLKEIQQHNDLLGRPKEELESLIKQMEEGKELVYKCSKIHRLNIRARIRYQEQLVALGESLLRFFMIDMQAQTARDSKETLYEVKRIRSAIDKLPLVITEDTTDSSSDPLPSLIDLSDREMYDSKALQPNDENATKSNPTEEATESEVLQSTSAKDAVGADSAEKVMKDIISLSQKVSQVCLYISSLNYTGIS